METMERMEAFASLDWLVAMGADEAIAEDALDRYALSAVRRPAPAQPRAASQAQAAPARPQPAPAAMVGLDGAEAAAKARAEAAKATSLEELRAALERFDALSLTRTATNLVFGDGNPKAGILVLGEAPGAEEDRIGKPFVGPSGLLWDRMLAAIGLDRSHYFISNMIYWRPPGNRTPTDLEVAACMPFALRMIELVQPRILVLLGRSAAGSMLEVTESMSKLRGRWRPFQRIALDPVPMVLPTYHPAYLLRTPLHKKYAWRDVLSLKARLAELDLLPPDPGAMR